MSTETAQSLVVAAEIGQNEVVTVCLPVQAAHLGFLIFYLLRRGILTVLRPPPPPIFIFLFFIKGEGGLLNKCISKTRNPSMAIHV